jgi:serine-type D-Ala-D-Ala carboxypeptidase (penicillin-binding protein 5/6)
LTLSYKISLVPGALLLAVLAATTLRSAPAHHAQPAPLATPPLITAPVSITPLGQPQPPADVDVAPVAMLVDMGSGRVLYHKDEARPFLPASVTKTMTTYVAFELLSQGKLKPDQVFAESAQAYKDWHMTGSRMFLERGQPVTVDQLLTGIMTVSANDGAVVLGEGYAGSIKGWTDLMNATAKKLGMNDSHFHTPNGYMDQGQTYVSARDLVKLATAMIERHPDLYHRYVGKPGLVFNGVAQNNHDPLLGKFPGADGIKTGFTGEAHYNYLGSAQRNGRRLIMVLAGVERPNDRMKAARALMEWGFDAWSDAPLFAQGQKLATAQVQGGQSGSVDLLTPRALSATVPHGARETVRMRITYDGPIKAPIARGAEVAKLEVKVGQDAPTVLPLVAAADVPAGGWRQRLIDGFRRMVS